MRLRAATVAALLIAGLAACGDDEDAAPPVEPADFAGEWTVSLSVGRVQADPAAEVEAFPDGGLFRETWVIDTCDETSCTLRRPDGGFLFGDLDGLRLELGDEESLAGDAGRLVGEGEAAAVPRPVDPEPCDRTPAQRWSIRVEIGVSDGVLSGSAFRTPEALVSEAEGSPCYGLDLTLGFSGTPRQ